VELGGVEAVAVGCAGEGLVGGRGHRKVGLDRLGELVGEHEVLEAQVEGERSGSEFRR
jgi:hypothetical protein